MPVLIISIRTNQSGLKISLFITGLPAYNIESNKLARNKKRIKVSLQKSL
jgi:hypothetical protein